MAQAHLLVKCEQAEIKKRRRIGSCCVLDIIPNEPGLRRTAPRLVLSHDHHPYVPLWGWVTMERIRISLICKLCLKTSRNVAYMRQHLKQHIGQNIYECPICKQAFGAYRNVWTHHRNHKETKIVASTQPQLSPPECPTKIMKISGSNGRALCQVVKKADGSLARASRDLLTALRLAGINDESKADEMFPFRCAACAEGFVSPEALMAHIVHEREATNLRPSLSRA